MTAKKDTTTKNEEPAKKDVVEEKVEAAPEPATEPVIEKPKGPAMREYVVTAGAAIAPVGNRRSDREKFGERARMYMAGEVVMLTAKEARHYVDLKRLDPYVPTDDE